MTPCRPRSARFWSRLPATSWQACTSTATPGPARVRGHRGGPAVAMRAVSDQLDGYFAGVRTRFDLPLHLEGTPFQVTVWSALVEIPFGETSTYAQLAGRIGRPRAARAVGAANGQNPDLDRGAVPPADRGEWRPHGIRLGARSQARPARARRRALSASGSIAPEGVAGCQAGENGIVTVSRSAARPCDALPAAPLVLSGARAV